jgi:hypothetical protein
MNDSSIGSFFCVGNDMFNGVFQRQTSFLSSAFSAPSLAIPMVSSQNSLRRSVAFFVARSLPRNQRNWTNDSDRFFVPIDNNLGDDKC